MAVRAEVRGRGGLDARRFPLPSLRDDAATLVDACIDATGCADLREPLTAFLAHTNAIPGIDAIALATWQGGQCASNLAVFAVADFAKIDGVSDALSEVFGIFDGAVGDLGPRIATGLWYVNTAGEPLDKVVPRLRRNLGKQPFFRVPIPASGFFRVAATDPG